MPMQDGVFRRRTLLQLLKRIQCRPSLTKFAIKLNVRRWMSKMSALPLLYNLQVRALVFASCYDGGM